MGSGLAAKRRGSRGRRRARCAHLTAEGVRCWPSAPRELRFWAQPAGRRAPTCSPHWMPQCPPPSRLVKLRKIPGAVPCVPSLLCPLRSRGSRVASPPGATLHNRGGGACPAAARGVTLHVAGLGPQRRRLRSPLHWPGDRDPVCLAGSAVSRPARLPRRCLWSAPKRRQGRD